MPGDVDMQPVIESTEELLACCCNTYRGKGNVFTIEQENWNGKHIYAEADTNSSHNHSEDFGGWRLRSGGGAIL